MKQKNIFYLLVIILCVGLASSGKNADVHEAIDSALLIQERVMIDSIQQLIISNDLEGFNDFFSKWMKEAELTFNSDRMLDANLLYLNALYPGYTHPNLEKTVTKTISLTEKTNSSEKQFDAWIALANTYYLMYEHELASQYASKALSYASVNQNVEHKIIANLALGNALLGLNNINESFQCFLNAKYSLKQLNHKDEVRLKSQWQGCMFQFYKTLGNFKEAKEYKIRQLRFAESQIPQDSMALMWNKYHLIDLALESGEEIAYKGSLDELLQFSTDHGYNRMKEYALTLYRAFMIEKKDLATFYDFYNKRYPGELIKMEHENEIQFQIFNAYFQEHLNNIDSATLLYKTAENAFDESTNPFYKANFYKRLGEFYQRNDKLDKAHLAFKNSIELSEEIDFEFNILPVSQKLHNISYQLGFIDEAYQYQQTHHALQLKKIEESHNDILLKMKLDSQKKEVEYIQQKEEQDRKNMFHTQFFAIAIGLIILLIILFIVSSMPVPEWTVDMLGFFSILFLFEFIILLLDHRIHELTHGAPIRMFLIKVVIISFIYPFHHWVEHTLISYLKKHNLIGKPNFSTIGQIFMPWLKNKE